MKNWDKMKDGLRHMYPRMEAEEFADMIDNANRCDGCGIGKYCDKQMFQMDADGNFIEDEQLHLVFRENAPTCKEVVLRWLMEEAE